MGCNDVGRRRRWWRWVPTGVSIPRCQARKPTPTPLSSSFVHPQAAVPAEPALSFSLSAHPVGPTTHHLRPLSYRLVFRPSPPTPRSGRFATPFSIRPIPHPRTRSHPRAEQLSGYELTELRSLCGGRASSYAAYRLQNVSDALCLCTQARTKRVTDGRDIALVWNRERPGTNCSATSRILIYTG